MGFLFQDAALFDSVTLFDNLALPLVRLTKKSPDESAGRPGERQVEDAVRAFRRHAKTRRARPCARARAEDSPGGRASSGLDRITASEIDDLLLQQKAEHKTTLIVVTHDVRGARRVGDRIIVLDQGRVIADGAVAEIERSEHATARRLVSEL